MCFKLYGGRLCALFGLWPGYFPPGPQPPNPRPPRPLRGEEATATRGRFWHCGGRGVCVLYCTRQDRYRPRLCRCAIDVCVGVVVFFLFLGGHLRGGLTVCRVVPRGPTTVSYTSLGERPILSFVPLAVCLWGGKGGLFEPKEKRKRPKNNNRLIAQMLVLLAAWGSAGRPKR